MFQKGRGEKGYSAKIEAKKKFPEAHVKRKQYGSITGYGLFLGKGEDWFTTRPAIICLTAEECWEIAMRSDVIGGEDER